MAGGEPVAKIANKATDFAGTEYQRAVAQIVGAAVNVSMALWQANARIARLAGVSASTADRGAYARIVAQ
jgi:Tfp pilus assembly protein PilV